MGFPETKDPGSDPRSPLLLAFKRAYIASAAVLTLVLGTAVYGYFMDSGHTVFAGVAVLIIAATLLPFFRKGSISEHWKYAIVTATLLATVSLIMLVGSFLDSLETGGRVAFFADNLSGVLFFLIPWLLTALRGIRFWKAEKMGTVVAPSRGSERSVAARRGNHAN